MRKSSVEQEFFCFIVFAVVLFRKNMCQFVCHLGLNVESKHPAKVFCFVFLGAGKMCASVARLSVFYQGCFCESKKKKRQIMRQFWVLTKVLSRRRTSKGFRIGQPQNWGFCGDIKGTFISVRSSRRVHVLAVKMLFGDGDCLVRWECYGYANLA